MGKAKEVIHKWTRCPHQANLRTCLIICSRGRIKRTFSKEATPKWVVRSALAWMKIRTNLTHLSKNPNASNRCPTTSKNLPKLSQHPISLKKTMVAAQLNQIFPVRVAHIINRCFPNKTTRPWPQSKLCILKQVSQWCRNSLKTLTTCFSPRCSININRTIHNNSSSAFLKFHSSQ